MMQPVYGKRAERRKESVKTIFKFMIATYFYIYLVLSVNRALYATYVNISASVSNFQVGGIYTVIRSKTGVSVNELGDQYILLGPYKELHAR